MTGSRNKLVERLRNDEPAFGGSLQCGDITGARSMGDSNFDFVMLDLEHEGFDMPRLGDTMQWMISRRRIVETSDPFPSPTPLTV